MVFVAICGLLSVVLVIVDKNHAWKTFGRVASVFAIVAILALAVVLEIGRETENRRSAELSAGQVTITPDGH